MLRVRSCIGCLPIKKMTSKRTHASRIRFTKEELEKLSKEELVKSWVLQESYIDTLEMKPSESSEHSELVSLRESEEKLKQQQLEATRRENILVMRLTTKEQEMQEYASQIQELKQGQIPSVSQLRSALLDPAVNLMFERMRKEVDSIKSHLEETQNELSAWKFTPDSNTGKRLMAKCRLLHQENEELGKIISSGRMAKLEGDLALQKSFSEEMKKSQSDLDEFLLELDEDVEGMQSTIYYLQQQLREAKAQVHKLKQDKQELSSLLNNSPTNHRLIGDENTDTEGETLLSPNPFILSKTENKSFHPRSVDIPNDVSQTENCEDLSSNQETNSCRPWSPSENHCDSHSEIFNKINDQKVPADDNRDLKPPDLVNDDNPLPSVPQNPNCGIGASEMACSKVVGSLLEETTETSVTKVNLQTDNKSTPIDNTAFSEKNKDFELQVIDDANKEILPENDSTVKNYISLSTKNVGNLAQRSNENGKSRKRTRPHTPLQQSVPEDCLEFPTVKRTKKKDSTECEKKPENQRTSLEINTDTEVQVAQTLALWATAKQDRTDGNINSQDTSDSLGNGELQKHSGEKE